MSLFQQILAIAGLVFGFGFVVFWHELGHFLAAKWVGIKVEQFAVGFGHAIVAWRKGFGAKVGTTTPAYMALLKEHLRAKEGLVIGDDDDLTAGQVARASQQLGLGETEYRLNWIPLGGYVKMLGQDDLNPNATSDDPRAYNRKSIGARMIVVSAGVIMNVILAGIGFTILFLILGFNAPPAIVGGVQVNSPAQLAGMRVGDQVLTMNGTEQQDFTKLALNTALVRGGQPISIRVKRVDGKIEDLTVTPRRPKEDAKSFFSLGVNQAYALRGMPAKAHKDPKNPKYSDNQPLDPAKTLLPGDWVSKVGDHVFKNAEEAAFGYPVLDAAVQQAAGKPVTIEVTSADGRKREIPVGSRFAAYFGEEPFHVAGMQPRAIVSMVSEDSPASGHFREGDVIAAFSVGSDTVRNPPIEVVRKLSQSAGENGRQIKYTVERDGKSVEIPPLTPVKSHGTYVVGIGLDVDSDSTVIGSTIPESSADKTRALANTRVLRVNGRSVANLAEMHQAMLAAGVAGPIELMVAAADGKEQAVALNLTPDERTSLKNLRYTPDTNRLILDPLEVERKTGNPLEAVTWGVFETRDLLLQFYVTLHRVTTGDVSVTNFMGPVGILHTGSKIAFKGPDWLLWFLCMISANLAVVNFLPIPIVDGGLFLFLIVEKIQKKPLSPRMQYVAQFVGLAIILTIFLLVTYQDIRRLFF